MWLQSMVYNLNQGPFQCSFVKACAMPIFQLILEYYKNSKDWDSISNIVMHPKDTDGIANSEDPDQTGAV